MTEESSFDAVLLAGGGASAADAVAADKKVEQKIAAGAKHPAVVIKQILNENFTFLTSPCWTALCWRS
jgi:hypothetical protein